MGIRIAALTLAAAFSSVSWALAQQLPPPCIPCAIAHQQSLQQVNNNNQIVREALQNQLNNQLQSQASSLQMQATLRSLELNGAMNAGSINLQQILLQQQIELLQIEQQALDSQRAAHPMKKNSKTKKPSVHPR